MAVDVTAIENEARAQSESQVAEVVLNRLQTAKVEAEAALTAIQNDLAALQSEINARTPQPETPVETPAPEEVTPAEVAPETPAA